MSKWSISHKRLLLARNRNKISNAVPHNYHYDRVHRLEDAFDNNWAAHPAFDDQLLDKIVSSKVAGIVQERAAQYEES